MKDVSLAFKIEFLSKYSDKAVESTLIRKDIEYVIFPT